MRTCRQVRARLGAKHVICVCSTYDSASVTAAAQRLLDCADVLRGVVDLSGALKRLYSVSILNTSRFFWFFWQFIQLFLQKSAVQQLQQSHQLGVRYGLMV